MVKIEDADTGEVLLVEGAFKKTIAECAASHTIAADPTPPEWTVELFYHEHAVKRLARYLNIPELTGSRWQSAFGNVSAAQPWGDRFWDGMQQLLMRYRHVPAHVPPQACHFILPSTFSQQRAQQPTGAGTPSIVDWIVLDCVFCVQHVLVSIAYVICNYDAARTRQCFFRQEVPSILLAV